MVHSFIFIHLSINSTLYSKVESPQQNLRTANTRTCAQYDIIDKLLYEGSLKVCQGFSFNFGGFPITSSVPKNVQTKVDKKVLKATCRLEQPYTQLQFVPISLRDAPMTQLMTGIIRVHQITLTTLFREDAVAVRRGVKINHFLLN